jgi:serine protease DegS
MNKLFKFFSWLSWPVLCGLLAAVIILDHLPGLMSGTAPHTPERPQSSEVIKRLSFSDAVKRAAPTVVNIYTEKVVREQLPAIFTDPFFGRFFNPNNIRERERVQRSLGSGVIMSPQGFIITNNHVINDVDTILVLLQDGREALAQVVGTDPDSDLAVLKINLENLDIISIGDPSNAMVGDLVLAIGNPYGFGQTVTQGIISATGRYGLRLSTYENYIQTDAAINPGNSGGALVDVEGNLLGINTAIYSKSGGSSGIGLAIPVTQALRIMSDLIQYGTVIRGWLGIEVRQLPKAIARANKLSLNNGVIITATAANGPAERSGLAVGDIITSINGQAVGDGQAGMNFIASTRPGDEVAIEVIRKGKTININSVVGSRP